MLRCINGKFHYAIVPQMAIIVASIIVSYNINQFIVGALEFLFGKLQTHSRICNEKVYLQNKKTDVAFNCILGSLSYTLTKSSTFCES